MWKLGLKSNRGRLNVYALIIGLPIFVLLPFQSGAMLSTQQICIDLVKSVSRHLRIVSPIEAKTELGARMEQATRGLGLSRRARQLQVNLYDELAKWPKPSQEALFNHHSFKNINDYQVEHWDTSIGQTSVLEMLTELAQSTDASDYISILRTMLVELNKSLENSKELSILFSQSLEGLGDPIDNETLQISINNLNLEIDSLSHAIRSISKMVENNHFSYYDFLQAEFYYTNTLQPKVNPAQPKSEIWLTANTPETELITSGQLIYLPIHFKNQSYENPIEFFSNTRFFPENLGTLPMVLPIPSFEPESLFARGRNANSFIIHKYLMKYGEVLAYDKTYTLSPRQSQTHDRGHAKILRDDLFDTAFVKNIKFYFEFMEAVAEDMKRFFALKDANPEYSEVLDAYMMSVIHELNYSGGYALFLSPGRLTNAAKRTLETMIESRPYLDRKNVRGHLIALTKGEEVDFPIADWDTVQQIGEDLMAYFDKESRPQDMKLLSPPKETSQPELADTLP